jgi:hypothetical protein
MLEGSGAGISFRMDSRFRGNDGASEARPCSNHDVIPAKAGIHPERSEVGWSELGRDGGDRGTAGARYGFRPAPE